MNKKTFFQKIENMPVPLLPTMVGAATLSNSYQLIGYNWIRHITMVSETILLLLFLVKIIAYNKTFRKEYSNTIPASLYAGFTMVLMIQGSYYFDLSPVLGKTLWFIAIGIHAIHILIFTYRNVIKGVKIDTFVPCWFVTYNGIMVSTVAGVVMNEPLVGQIIVYYGIGIYAIIIPFMVYRLMKYEVKDALYHTQAVVLAPCSLCVVGYLNFFKQPNLALVSVLYVAVLLSLAFIIYKIPKFFSYSFTPGYSGITFPMAIGVFASIKMSAFLTASGYDVLGRMVKELSGIQIYMTTAIIAFVLYNFMKMFVESYKN